MHITNIRAVNYPVETTPVDARDAKLVVWRYAIQVQYDNIDEWHCIPVVNSDCNPCKENR